MPRFVVADPRSPSVFQSASGASDRQTRATLLLPLVGMFKEKGEEREEAVLQCRRRELCVSGVQGYDTQDRTRSLECIDDTRQGVRSFGDKTKSLCVTILT